MVSLSMCVLGVGLESEQPPPSWMSYQFCKKKEQQELQVQYRIDMERVDNLVFFLILEELLLSFSPFSLMLAVGLLYIAFIMFSYVPVIPDISKTFIMKGC
ncbi:hypothetical protein H671_2g5334 [Cricetulus griseus]|nr:hypothetical protein H671_2g5334 [Cricetulus griseus]